MIAMKKLFKFVKKDKTTTEDVGMENAAFSENLAVGKGDNLKELPKKSECSGDVKDGLNVGKRTLLDLSAECDNLEELQVLYEPKS